MSSSPDSPVGSPLSPAQRDLLLEASSSPGAAPLVIGTSVALGPEVDPDRWRRAAEAVFAAEPGMRLRLAWRNGEPWQELDPQARLRTEVAELKEAGSPHEDVGAWTMARLAARPAIETDPSWAHALVRDRTGTWHAVLMSPHIFVDGHAYRHFFETDREGLRGSLLFRSSGLRRAPVRRGRPRLARDGPARHDRLLASPPRGGRAARAEDAPLPNPGRTASSC